MKEKLERLKILGADKADAFLFIKFEEMKENSLRYLTNFSGENGIFLQINKKAFILVYRMDKEKAKIEKFKNLKLEIIEKEGITATLLKIFKKEKIKIKKIGINDNLPYYFIKALRKKLKNNGIKLIILKPVVPYLRKIKTKEEIEILKKAQRITDKIFEEILNYLEPKKHTEKDIAFKIEELAIRKYGAEGLSFEPIVASGSGSAIPHYKPQNKKIKNNSPLLIDFGIKYKGYVSDMTRTIWIGKKVNKDFKKAYEIVLTAQKMAIEKCYFQNKELAKNVDKSARDYINSTKFKNLFIHSTGHGIGMDVHELPTLSPYSKDILNGNEVVTIEPGIYLPKRWGIRIEDTIVTGSGINLTKSPKELIVF